MFGGSCRIQFRVAASNDRGIKNPVIVIDNYDSFTYNLCQEKAKRRPRIPRLRNAPGFWNTPTDEKGGDGLFAGLSNPFTAGRYRSLVVEKESFPGEELEVTAWTEDGLIMAARHRKYKHLQMQSSTKFVVICHLHLRIDSWFHLQTNE
ncbi:hypothetical protein OIU78_004641 [Salix suchowensis]|nr:hypothetical protein OIU78_004641 [Salix suchowensis]